MQTIFLALLLFVKQEQQMVGQNMNWCILISSENNEVILSIKNAIFVFFIVWEFWGKMISMVYWHQYSDLYLPINKNMEVMSGPLMFTSSSLLMKRETPKKNLLSSRSWIWYRRLKELTPITWRFIANLSIFHQ